MKVFTYSEARQNFAHLLALAQEDEVEIRRKDGTVFSLTKKTRKTGSPLDVAGLKTKATTRQIIDAVRESRNS
jgi:hypothetical protein